MDKEKLLDDYSDEIAWLNSNKSKYSDEDFKRLQDEIYNKYFKKGRR